MDAGHIDRISGGVLNPAILLRNGVETLDFKNLKGVARLCVLQPDSEPDVISHIDDGNHSENQDQSAFDDGKEAVHGKWN
jgi:hypothetical protein